MVYYPFMSSSPLAFIISAWILSHPGLFLSFRELIAGLISHLKGVLHSDYSCSDVIPVSSAVLIWLSSEYISAQYSFHLPKIFSDSVNVFPYLSLIKPRRGWKLFVRLVISSYISLLLFSFIWSSILVHFAIRKLFLSFLHSCFTSLASILYASFCVPQFFLHSFLSFILLSVCSDIHFCFFGFFFGDVFPLFPWIYYLSHLQFHQDISLQCALVIPWSDFLFQLWNLDLCFVHYSILAGLFSFCTSILFSVWQLEVHDLCHNLHLVW